MEVQKLINEVIAIDRMVTEENKNKGEFFNIIKIMNMASSEVNTHTPIIADLLNPRGSHGQGSIFLIKFLKNCNVGFDVNNKVRVFREKRFSCIDSGVTGQIDIGVENEDHLIVIENKIYAQDEPLQVYRYYQYAKQKFNKVTIIYLSMQDNLPSLLSLGEIEHHGAGYHLKKNQESVDLIIINYKYDICGWLNDCLKIQNVNGSNLQFGIQQYLNLIKQMTNQIMTSKEQIQDLLIKSDYEQLIAVKHIHDEFESGTFRGVLLFDFFNKIKHILLHELPIQLSEEFKSIHFDLEKCRNWFSGKNSDKNNRDTIGCVFSLTYHPSKIFIVIVATDWLHYGLVSLDESEATSLLNSELHHWKPRSNWHKLPDKNWISRAFCDIRNFNIQALRLLTLNDDLVESNLVKDIKEDFYRLFPEQKYLMDNKNK